MPVGCSVLLSVMGEYSGMRGGCGSPTPAGKAGSDSSSSLALPARRLLPHPVPWLPPAPALSPLPQTPILQGAGRMLAEMAATRGGLSLGLGMEGPHAPWQRLHQSCSRAAEHPLSSCSGALA